MSREGATTRTEGLMRVRVDRDGTTRVFVHRRAWRDARGRAEWVEVARFWSPALAGTMMAGGKYAAWVPVIEQCDARARAKHAGRGAA